MKILSIETSADETGVSVVDATGDFPTAKYELLGNGLRSQIELHNEYGGIFPMMAKREHAKAIVPLLQFALEEAGLLEMVDGGHAVPTAITAELETILEREPALLEALQIFTAKFDKPAVDIIAVTSGPGLTPALWVGVNFAKALAALWGVKVITVNHMEGHILASIYDVVEDDRLAAIEFPSLALLVSGGHTELVLMRNWLDYEKIGQTVDDAVGEAFDKVARLMGLPYPGGPEIGRLAAIARQAKLPPFKNPLPRPMLKSGDYNFSFSGLKTAVRYAIADQALSDTGKQALARDFEDAAVEVLVAKTSHAVATYGSKSVVVGGGVSASTYLRYSLREHFLREHPECELYFPKPGLSTDNAIMIALAAHAHIDSARNAAAAKLMQADGNMSL